MNPLRQKLFDGLTALDKEDVHGYLGAILFLQYYQRDYDSQKAIRLLDEVSEDWSKMWGRCAYCGGRETFHDPRV